jgi:SAM-dependent methyltransferase
MNYHGVEICCPVCHGDLKTAGENLTCLTCARAFPVIAGIPDLRIFPDPYIDFETDRAKARDMAAQLDSLSFSDLIDYYYSRTSVVPPAHAAQYKRGLLAGVARAEAALQLWDKAAQGATNRSGTLLEIGCGTGPLLVAARTGFRQLVGIDIALRWLVVGKKRLMEAGLNIPLICCCAEALPFPGPSFDCVVMDSALEMVADQARALAESHRTMRSGAHLFLSTPNRFSLGPDPHIGVWAGGMWPQQWLAAYARKHGAIPPKRHLLWKRSLAELIGHAGFEPARMLLPTFADEQRNRFPAPMRALIDLYHAAQRIPLSQHMLFLIGPLLYAVSRKGAVEQHS